MTTDGLEAWACAVLSPTGNATAAGTGGALHAWPWRLLGYVWLLRCANALVVRTYFDPDEFWQSLEVGHRMAFGYGASPPCDVLPPF